MIADTGLICVTHKVTGCFLMVFTSNSMASYKPAGLATYINNYSQRSIRGKLENWALKEFADAYSPVSADDFKTEVLVSYFTSKEQCKKVAAEHAKKLGVNRLLSSRIIPTTLWTLNAQAKQRLLSGLNIYKSNEQTTLTDVDFPLSMVENFLARYDAGFTTDAMRQLRKQVKQYREQSCLSKSETRSTL